MNQRERDEYRPLCERCGELVTDIDWCDVYSFGGGEAWMVGRMRCTTADCYDANGSRETSPIVPGGLTIEDHAWLRRYGVLDG